MTHRFSTLLSILVPASLVLAAGCSDGGSASASAALEDSVEAGCAKIFSCMSTFPGTPAQFTETFGASATACVTEIGPTTAEKVALDASVSAGRIKFNAADASACTAAFGGVTCEQLWGGTFEEPAVCDTAIVGTVAVGGTCTTVTVGPDDVSDVGDCAGDAGCNPTTMKCE